MKQTFRGYYRPTNKEFAELWSKCVFVLDANTLLNFYRYTRTTNEKLSSILSKISDRLWVPHQAALEYQQGRLAVISRHKKDRNDIKERLKNAPNLIEEHFENQPFVETKSSLKKIKKLFSDVHLELDKHEKDYPDLLAHDSIREDTAWL